MAIVGRPNVGKSTLFNRLIGERRSIVGDEPGITRDRIYGQVEWAGTKFSLIDTGGIVPDDDAVIPANILKQAGMAIDEAQVLIWVVERGPASPSSTKNSLACCERPANTCWWRRIRPIRRDWRVKARSFIASASKTFFRFQRSRESGSVNCSMAWSNCSNRVKAAQKRSCGTTRTATGDRRTTECRQVVAAESNSRRGSRDRFASRGNHSRRDRYGAANTGTQLSVLSTRPAYVAKERLTRWRRSCR